MDVIEVDAIGLEPAEAGIDGVDHMAPGEAAVVGARSYPVANLGGDDPGLAPPLEDLPDYALRARLAMDIGRIEEVHALLEGIIEHAPRLRLPGRAAEHHRAERDFRNLEATYAQRAIAHLCHQRASP